MQPISFLPQDKVDQGIQNLGNTLSQINESKIARKQEQIKQFHDMLDISLQGVKGTHYKEALGDLEKFTKQMTDTYMKAEQEGRSTNGMDDYKLTQAKRDLINKVNIDKAWWDRYKQAGVEILKLKSDPGGSRISDEDVQAFDKLATDPNPPSIMDMPDPYTYVNPRMNAIEAAKYEELMLKGGIEPVKTSTPKPGMPGAFDENTYRDPETIGNKVDMMGQNKAYTSWLQSQGKTIGARKNELKAEYTGLKQNVKQKPAPLGGYAPRSDKPIWFTHDDGTMTSSPTNDTPRNINGVLTRPAGDRTLKQNGVITYPMQEFKATPRYGNIYNGKKLSDKLSDADNMLTGNLFKDKTYQDLKNYDESHKDRWKKEWVDVTHSSQESDAYGQWWGDTKESTRGNAKPVKPSGTKPTAKGGVIDLTTF